MRALVVATLLMSNALGAQTTTPPAPAAVTQAAPPPGVDTLLDARAKNVASRLRCPVCQGESIQDSPAELAAQMKTLVREQLANGKSETEVLGYFTQKYGQWILLEPQAQGLNLIVYWVPVLFLVFGGAGLWFVVKRWTRPRIAVEDEPSTTVIDNAQP
jgi:cytochrome c-type biogenesis protein CcmH